MKSTSICFALTAIVVFAQTKPAFEVATVKPGTLPDRATVQAAMKAGGKIPLGPRVDAGRAEYTYMNLKSLIGLAYAVTTDQIAGPDWMDTTYFDIVAKMPEGVSKDEAPRMLQSLLEERFGLAVHRAGMEHSVLALVVGKGGLKMKPSAQIPVDIRETAPSKPGEGTMETANGTVRLSPGAGMSIDMGSKGKMSIAENPATRSMHVDFSRMTMAGIAGMLTLRSTPTGGPVVVDMTGIEGSFDASLDITDAAPEEITASDPAGGSSVTMAREIQLLGLKLESRKAVVEQLVVDHVEKMPTAN